MSQAGLLTDDLELTGNSYLVTVPFSGWNSNTDLALELEKNLCIN